MDFQKYVKFRILPNQLTNFNLIIDFILLLFG